MKLIDKITGLIDSLNKYIGLSISWLVVIMVVLTFINTVYRRYFGGFSVGTSEAVMIMHAVVFMLGAGYTLQKNQHVRVDIFYSRMTIKQRAIVNLIGSFIFLIPFCFFIIIYSWGFVTSSWDIHEISSTTDGLPCLYLVKTMIPVMAALLLIQSISEILKNIQTLIKRGC